MKFTARKLTKNIYREKDIQEVFFYNKITLIIDSFVDMHKLSKKDFLKKVFDAAFVLIPEAQKGSFYELNDEMYIPIFSKGYDLNILQKLAFNRNDAFIDFECSDTARIDAFAIYISKRDDSMFAKETIEIFKQLGTYADFYSLYAPIQYNGLNLGLICLENFDKTGFSTNSKQVLKFYAQMISNFYSQKLHQEKETKMYHDIVTALVSAIEVKDEYTEGHAQRVKEYSCAIAEYLKLSNEQINNIRTASLLHDIGKIGISTEILNKPGKLTDDEYMIIKNHPIYAKKILEKISGFSAIVDFAYMHHEHYDGSGYPQGLRSDEIPIESQIIQLADAFDAMTSERSYRKALAKSTAIEIIQSEKGKQFHPEVAEAAIILFSDNDSMHSNL